MADQNPPAEQQAAPAAAAPVALPTVAETLAPIGGTETPGGPATGTVTPALSELPLEQVEYSLRVSLAERSAKGQALYGHKNYEEASEVFAQAAEMQAEMNGEMDPRNAEILFYYGRSLFKVGQSKSDVLGGKAPEAKSKKAAPKKAKSAAPKQEEVKTEETKQEPTEAEKVTEAGVAIVAAEASKGASEEGVEGKKPLFQFTGDENFDDSDEDEEAEGEGEDDDEEDDDLAVAFEILDLARVLFLKRLEQAEAQAAETKPADTENPEGEGGEKLSIHHIKERLADTHDLLAEIQLENERYPNAITDSRASLKYKKELYPEDSEIIAEAHFKLSLALEFAAITTSEEDKQKGEQQVDQALRDEAATELEAAIASTRLKLQNKEVELATLHSPEDNELTRKQIAEVKEIIADMEQRLADLRKPPVDVNAVLGNEVGNAMGGILGATLGESAAETEARVEEAKKTATDLTGLVRKKNKDDAPKPAPATQEPAKTNGSETNGKRKAEDSADGGDDQAKKAKVDVAA